MVKLTVVIPTYKEKEHIKTTIAKVYSNLSKLNLNPEIIIVDDSEDETYSIIKRLQKKHNSLKVIHRVNKRGVGSAIRLGIAKAKGKYVIVFMSDAPDDTKYFPAILQKLESGYDLVQTSRFLKGCKMVGYPFIKKVFNWLCNNFIKIAFLEFRLKDFSSLFKGFNREKINALNLNANEFDIGLEIALKSMRNGYSIAEVPVNWVERERGESKLFLSRLAIHYVKRVFGTWLNYSHLQK